MAEVPRKEEDKFFPDDDSKEFYAYYWVEGITPEWAYEDDEWYEENGGEPEDWTRWVFELQLYEWDEDGDMHDELLLTVSGSFDKHIESGVDDGSYTGEDWVIMWNYRKLKKFYLSDSFVDFQRFVTGINRVVTNRLTMELEEKFPPAVEVTSNLINWNQHPPQL